MKSVCRKFGLILVCLLGVYASFAQDTETQELRYFKSDDAFYLGNKRLLDNEIEKALLNNLSAFDAWKRGNKLKKDVTSLKITTGVCLGVGVSLFSLWPFFIVDPDATATVVYATAGALTAAGIVTGIMIPITKAKYKSYYSNAAGIYNKSKNAVSLHIGTTGNGIGFSLKF